MGVQIAEIKGSRMMILKFICRGFDYFCHGCYRATFSLFCLVFSLTVVQPTFAERPPVLIVLGDSLVAGHGLPQGQSFPDVLRQMLKKDGVDVQIINAGVSGDTTAGGLARLDWSLADNPNAAIIVLGGNDLLRGLEPAASYSNLDRIISRLKAKNVAILLAGMQAPRNLGAVYADEFDRIYQKLAQRHNVLLYPFFLDGVALRPAMNQFDGMHPNNAGVKRITKRILPQVKALLKKAVE
jgi:acyl-CoA thioesterase-1